MIAADISWMLVATVLVLLMTPAVGFFYGGMVSRRNAVSTTFQSFICIGVVGLLWAICGYSLVFSGDTEGFIGNFDYAFLKDVGIEPNADYGSTIPHVLFMLFQATFAVITPALISGSMAGRIRFKAWFLMMPLWSLFVYVPVAHWVWGPNGWIGQMGGLDFAGGLVVHMTSGFAAVVAALMLGNRAKFKPDEHGFSATMVLLGTALLWVGWFGFNAGSALAANGLAAYAAGTTFFAAVTAMTVWVLCDWVFTGRPSAVGSAVGAVAGLVAVTPAAGFVTMQSAIIIGAVAAILCYGAVRLVKQKFKTDDTVDVFACHGVGGTVGTILTAVFATTSINPDGADGLLYGSADLLYANVIGAVVVVAYTLVMTFIILKVISFMTPLRVSEKEEQTGLDLSQHGEKVFSLN
ncbi:MAG: ammonia channel protein [Micavibrio sp.]|nr:ammonia channel protein [Micavibrio sp.]HCK32753.1 ammonia channel protein [Rhodospirillaceae bacterium]